jgi:hypothetical protein
MTRIQSVRRVPGANTSGNFWARALVTSIVAFAIVGPAMADREDDDNEAYAIGLWGDLPYNDIQATTGVPNLIADMNAQSLKFTVHDGDLKSGRLLGS